PPAAKKSALQGEFCKRLSSANIGAERLSSLARELEIIGGRGRIDDARPILSTFEQELTRVLAALTALK
ncbi:MAG TPA: Hpt domain-containing protein, partial [Accumulibacter sp.]|nr:Hpt domain-containing protein [Accumulibacter sp.]